MLKENDSIEKLELPYRVYNLLKKNNFNTIYDLLSISLKDLSKIDGFGKYAISEIKKVLWENNLKNVEDEISNSYSIECLKLSPKANKTLISCGIYTIGELLSKNLFVLSDISNIGIKTISEIVGVVYKNRLTFQDEDSYMRIFPYINLDLRQQLIEVQKSNIGYEQIVLDKKNLLLLLKRALEEKEALIENEKKLTKKFL